MRAQNDMNLITVLHDLNQSVDNNETKSVAGNYSLTAGGQEISLNGTVAVNGSLSLSGILSGDGSDLTNLQASDLEGALPAISGASLTGLTVGQVANASGAKCQPDIHGRK